MIGIEEETGLQRVDGTPVPDTTLDDTSTNSVQNKVVTANINQINTNLTDWLPAQNGYAEVVATANQTIASALSTLASRIDFTKVKVGRSFFHADVGSSKRTLPCTQTAGDRADFGALSAGYAMYVTMVSSSGSYYAHQTGTGSPSNIDYSSRTLDAGAFFRVYY